MQNVTCQNCGERFEIPDYKDQKYCSRDCVYDAQRGKSRSEKTRRKIAEANTGKEYSESRKQAIGDANRKPIPDAKSEKAARWLSYSCIPHSVVKSELGLSKKRYRRLRKQLTDQVDEVSEAESNRVSHVYSEYELTPSNILTIRNHLDEWNRHEIRDKFFPDHVKPDTVANFCERAYGKKPKDKTPEFHGGKTAPERQVENFIAKNGWEYAYNAGLKYEGESDVIWYSVDFVVEGSVFVEVHGDFWHANPEIYDWDELYGHQRSTVNKDRRKKAQLMDQHDPAGYFEVWENDIKNNTDTFQQQKQQIRCTVQSASSQ